MKKICISIITSLLIFSCNSTKLTDEQKSKEKLIQIAHHVYNRGLNFGTGGDISIRIPGEDKIYIKATGKCFGDLKPEDLSCMNLDGEVIGGVPAPSHEATIHCAIYKERPDIKAIMHVHATHVTAWASAGRDIPLITQQARNILNSTRRVPYYPILTEELHSIILEQYADTNIEVVIMENHGVFVAGSSLDEIYYKADLLENTARIAYLSEQLGTLIILDN